MAKNKQFIPGLKVEMEDVSNKAYDIADWFHTHYSHTVKNEKKRKIIFKQAHLDGYYEEGNKVYVIT